MRDFEASIRHTGDPSSAAERIGPRASGRLLVIAAGGCCAAALILVGARLYAFEIVIAAAAAFLSADGIVEAGNRRMLSAALIAAAALAALAAALLFALSVPAWRAALDAFAAWDPLRRVGLDVPSPHLVLAFSTALGMLVIAAFLVSRRLGGLLGWMFEKEGPLEFLTVVLELAAAVWCFAAARRWQRARERTVPALYAALALILLLVGMEELNWGQTLLAFETPPAWAAINHQQETSLHNLLNMQALNAVTYVLAASFVVGVLVLSAVAHAAPRSAFAAIAPPAALGVLAALTAAGAYLHAEVFELLLAIFFAFYSYRIYQAARRTPHMARGAPMNARPSN